MSALSLGVQRILNLYPAMLRVDTSLPLADDTFKISLADFLEHQLALSLNVLCIDQFRTIASADQSLQAFLSFDQWGMTKIGIVEP